MRATLEQRQPLKATLHRGKMAEGTRWTFSKNQMLFIKTRNNTF